MRSIVLLFSMFLTTIAFCQKQNSYPLVHVEQLSKAPADTIRLKAYVLDVYTCPPCPPGMICKPCTGNHVTIAEEKPKDMMKISSDKRIRIFTENPKGLTPGKRYVFTLRFKNKKASPVDNLELISFR